MDVGASRWRRFRCPGKRLEVFVGALKHSRLVGDLLDLAIRDQKQVFARKLEPQVWREYVAGCRARDVDLEEWAESTTNKLRQVVCKMLMEVGFLESPQNPAFQTVFLMPELDQYLRDHGDHYALRCMEVMQ